MKDLKKNKIKLEKLPKYLFVFSLVFSLGISMFILGFFAHKDHVFPYSLIKKTSDVIDLIFKTPKHYIKTNYTKTLPVYDKNAANNGPSLVTLIKENNALSAKIIEMDGSLIHEWVIDWFEIWPDAKHLPKEKIPKSRPGSNIHGAVVLDNGDLIFNFSQLGLVRLDVCGNVVWRLPYRTHHSIHQDEYHHLWVPGVKKHKHHLSGFPNNKPPVKEMTILKISLEGKILNEISVMDLLKENDLSSLLYMSRKLPVSGDILHMNDIETFPSDMEEGVFKASDIMVSFRNINTIIILRENDRKIKHVLTGGFVWQHDPDFIDGNTISIFDNNVAPAKYKHHSRILIKSFLDDQSHVYYSGSKENPFYTRVMGKHQWLQNGNLLITEAKKGRAFEIDKRGKIVWEYVNIVKNGYCGLLTEVQRLENKYTKDFFDREIKNCSN